MAKSRVAFGCTTNGPLCRPDQPPPSPSPYLPIAFPTGHCSAKYDKLAADANAALSSSHSAALAARLLHNIALGEGMERVVRDGEGWRGVFRGGSLTNGALHGFAEREILLES